MGKKNRVSKFMVVSLFVMLATTGCQTDGKGLKGEYGVIFTDCIDQQSELIGFDGTGNKVSGIPFSARCAFKVQHNLSGGYTLPAESDNKITRISEEGKVEIEEVQTSVWFVKETPKLTVISYNNDLKKNTLEIREEGKKTSIEWKGLLTDAQWDEKYIYVYSDNIGNVKPFIPSILLIDRKSKKVTKEIKLEETLRGASSIELMDNRVIIPARHNKLIASLDIKTGKVEKHPVPFDEPIALAKHGDHLFMIDAHGESVELDQQLRVVRHKKISSDFIISMRIFSDGLYLLRQDPNWSKTKLSGSIEIYDWKTLEEKKKINMPDFDNNMVPLDVIRWEK